MRSTGSEYYMPTEYSNNRCHTANSSFARSVKFKVKSMRNTKLKNDPKRITFGSSCKIRTKISKVDSNIEKLHSKSRSNWSKKDLKTKYLLNGTNFKVTYDRGNMEIFDQLKTQQINTTKAKKSYQGVITGSPYTENDNYPNITTRVLCQSSATLDKNSNGLNPSTLSQPVISFANTMNNDQKMSYLSNCKAKYKKTHTINKDNQGGKSSRVVHSSNPFTKDFGLNTQSKLRNHEKKRPQTSAVNHTRDMYDPLTRVRSNQTSVTKGHQGVRKSNKSQTISAFNHLGRIQAPNFSREYQKAYANNGNAFKRAKGMCSEMVNASQKHTFIATPFGTRS